MKLKFIVLILLVASLLSLVSKVQAKDTPPEPKAEQIGAMSGIQILPGWNYFNLNDTSCSLEILYNEMQADAGGGIYIGELWSKNGKNAWQQHTYGKENLLTTLASDTLFAYFSEKRFFFDMSTQACSEEPKIKRTTQIAAARVIAETNEIEAMKAKEESEKKIQALQQASSPVYTFKLWLSQVWSTILAFFQKFSIKK